MQDQEKERIRKKLEEIFLRPVIETQEAKNQWFVSQGYHAEGITGLINTKFAGSCLPLIPNIDLHSLFPEGIKNLREIGLRSYIGNKALINPMTPKETNPFSARLF